MLGLRRFGTCFPRLNAQLNSQLHQVPRSPRLDWPDFFKLRQRRRKIRLVSGFVGAFVGANLAFVFVGEKEIDFEDTLMGIPVIYVYGGGIFAAGAAGFLLGPSLGDIAFKLLLGSRTLQFETADNIFLKHISANRPNPAKMSMTNPLNDFYGEKIGSVHDYRRWLREARLFKKRAEKFL